MQGSRGASRSGGDAKVSRWSQRTKPTKTHGWSQRRKGWQGIPFGGGVDQHPLRGYCLLFGPPARASSLRRSRTTSPAVAWLIAEREGFEPPVPLRAHLFSRQTRSTTLAPLRTGRQI